VQVTAVTSFSRKGFASYGRRCLTSFLQYWPSWARMIVYVEDAEQYIEHPRLVYNNLLTCSSECLGFVSKYRDDPKANGHSPVGYKFKLDAVRFCYKVFAMAHAVRAYYGQDNHIIWLDGDVVTHAPVSVGFIESICPPDKAMAVLDRGPKKGMETGYIHCRPEHHGVVRHFFSDYQRWYTDGLIFDLSEWHDGFVFNHLLRQSGLPYHNLAAGLTRLGHPFVDSPLGDVMDHLKGQRKEIGRTPSQQLAKRRTEGYWR
jgi:hypothetical protein